MVQYFPVVTGSLTVTGSINVSGGITASGGISIPGSIASASFASTASFVALAQSASNAVAAATASFANAFTVAGNLTAQTLVVQTITSSVDFVTGSTRFGSIAANTHQFTGSMSVSGSAVFSSTIRSNDTSGLALGSIAGYRRLQYDLANTRFGFLTDTNSLANIEANAVTASSITTSAYSYLYGLRISGNDTGNTIYAGSSNMGITAESGYNISIGAVSDVTKALNIKTATGNVSINTNSSYARLHVNGASLDPTAETTYGIWVSSAATIEKGLILGYNNVNDVGIINAAHRGVTWKNIALGTNSGTNVLIGTTTSNGSKFQVAGGTSGTKFNTFNGSLSVDNNTATFMQQCSADGGQGSIYLIIAAIGGAGSDRIAMGILVTISQGGGTARWAYQSDGVNMFLTDPGSNGNIYVRHTAGGTQTINYSILRIA